MFLLIQERGERRMAKMANMDLIGVMFFLLFIVLTIKAIAESAREHGKISSSGRMICPECGTRGEPKITTRGSMVIEFVLWMCFFAPGLIYAIWRETKKTRSCPSCGAVMIEVNSPVGKSLVNKLAV
jgi:rubredoxin